MGRALTRFAGIGRSRYRCRQALRPRPHGQNIWIAVEYMGIIYDRDIVHPSGRPRDAGPL